MPTLNYSPVPSVEPTVTPSSTFQTIQPTPNAFGAAQGQALSNLGQTFERAGSQLADVALQRQHLFNQVAASDASTKWQDATSKILYGDPDNPNDVGFYGLKGDAAMRQFPVVRKQLDDLLREHRTSLQNPMQQMLFDQETRRLRSYLMSETGRHYDQENSRWTQSVYKGQTEQALQNGARAIASGNDFDTFLQQGAEAITKGAKAAGKSSDEAMAEVNHLTTTFVEMQADKLSADDPRTALQFIQNHRDQFKDPEKYLQLEDRVKAQAIKKTAQDVANGVPGPGLTSNLVRGGAVDKYSGDVADKMEQTFRARGWSDAAIAGAMNNALGESSLNPTATGGAGEKGYFQFHPKTHLPVFQSQYGGDFSPEAQANYVADVVEKTMPSFKNVTDSRAATAQFLHGFERPADQSESEINRRFSMGYRPQVRTVASVPTVNVTDTPLGTTAAAPPDQLIVPPPEPGEYPDAEVPGLLGELKRITQDPRIANAPANFKADLFNAAVKETRQKYNMLYTEQRRQHQQAQEAQKAQDQQIMDSFERRMTSNSPNYPTGDEILSSKLSPESKRTMVGFLERQTKPDPLAHISAQTQMDLFRRMQEDYTGDDKVTNERQINQEYIGGKMTDTARKATIGDFREIQASKDKELTKRTNDLLKAIEVKLVPSLQFGREAAKMSDPGGEERVLGWKNAVTDKIKEFRDAGKNPATLFVPGTRENPNPDFVGGEGFIRQFQGDLGKQLQDKTPPGALDLSTPDKIKAAYTTGKLSYEAAAGELIKRGFARPAAPEVRAPLE